MSSLLDARIAQPWSWQRVLKVLPPGLSRVFYSDNGSTAIEAAAKMAMQYWRNRGRPRRSFSR